MSNYLKFKNLHYGDVPLVLGIVWDVPSAKLMDSLGFEAIGTSSAAIAEMLGYKDGEQLSFEELLFVVERIVKCVNVPLSVDMESGYGKSAKEIVENVLRLVRLGVVGINIEDSQVAGERKMLSAHQFQSILEDIKE